ncbi:ABC transporter permease [Nocardiopsis ansamitocini]|uniref:ABC transporter permease n=1 Tax=Nocardiopsis ansamitocini TaxID=1670832 RepID=A0A9W6P8J6_9ACTN|nr:ABC transporter permease [Nocardiopsis ansamitocini]GLU49091.1 ABC transporter permease [Nocardiopsis ansamitocini]
MATVETVRPAKGRVRARPWRPEAGPVTGLLLAAPMLVAIVLFVAFPLVQVFVDASSGGVPVQRYTDVFTNPVSRRALATTLTDSALVAVVTVALGAVIAWTLHTTARRWVRVLLWTTALVPFWMGMIIKNYAIYLLLAANGPLNALLMGLGVVDSPLSLLYTKFAVVYGISYSLLPYAVLALYSVFVQVDRSLLSSAAVLGAGRAQVLATVVAPLVRGGVLVALALIFLLSIGFYVTPIMLGGLQTPFMATVINQQVFSLYDFPGAAASAAILLVIAFVVVATILALAGGKTLRRML